MLSLTEARAIIGGPLGRPSKMPGYSFGLSALDCKAGSKLRKVENSTCSKCYALKGRYLWPNTGTAHARRLKGLKHPLWCEAMARLISHHCAEVPFFRWHDSGDIQGVWHLRNICAVARCTPSVKHWLPTRERAMVHKFSSDIYFKRNSARCPPNLVIRLSATMIDGRAPSGMAVSTVSTFTPDPSAYRCPAPINNPPGHCGECRACWDHKVRHVDYHLH